MSSKKLKLSELKIQSFVTSVDNESNVRGQGSDNFEANCSFGGYSQTSCGTCECGGGGPVDPSYATCNVVYCATNEQSCTNDGTATCKPNEGC